VPKYKVTVGDSKYKVDAPDARTAWARANRFHEKRVTAETKPKEESSALKDYGSALAAGAGKILPSAVKGVAQIGDLLTGGRYDLGVQQAMTDTMTSVEDYWRTENLTKKSKEFERLMQDDEFGVGDMLSYLLDNPELLVEKTVETTGSMLLPLGAAGAVGKAGKMLDLAQPTIAKALTATTVGTTMAQNAADTFASPELQDMPLEDRYKAAGVSAVASLLAGVITKGGAEGTIAKKLLSEVEEGKVNVGKIKNFLQSVGTTFVKEGFQEGVEESGNVLGTVVGGAEVTPEGAAKQIALSTTIGGLMGAGVGAVARPSVEQPEAPPTEFSPESLGIDPEMAARIAAAERARVMAPAPAEEEAPTPPSAVSPAQVQAVTARANEIMAATGADPISAASTAAKEVVAQPKAPTRITLPELDAARVAEIEQELIASGRPPNEAKYYAAVRARREKAFASQAQAPAQVAGEPVGGGVGVSPTVPVPPTTRAPTGLPQAPQRSGVVRAGETAGEDSGATSTEPTSLKPKRIKYDQYAEMMATLNPQQQYASVVERVRAGPLAPKVTDIQKKTPGLTRKDAQDIMVRLEANGIVTPVGEDGKRTVIPTAAPAQKVSSMVSRPAQEQDVEAPPVVFDQALLEVAKRDTAGLQGMASYDLQEDVQGVLSGKPRALDRSLQKGLYTEDDIAQAFQGTRDALRQRYGDRITLWRADAPEKQRNADTRTVLMADQSTAQKFANNGREAKAYSVPVDDVLAINALPNGYYEAVVRKSALSQPRASATKKDIKAQQGTSDVAKRGKELFPYLKDFDSALNAIVEKATNPAQRLIAQRIRQRATELKKLGFKFSLVVTPEGKLLTSGARGTSTLQLSGLGEATTVDIILNHPSNGDQSGTNWKTVAHELAHAVTQAQIKLNPEGSAARQLRKLFNDLLDHFNAKVEAGMVDGKLKEGALTPFEERIYNRQINALKTPDEILAWGLTDTEMQKWLDSIPSKQGTFLSRLFNVVASALGFTRTNTALAELLTVSDTLLAGPLSPYVKAAESKRLSFGLQENKTDIPSWALMYAEGRKVVWHDKDAALIAAESILGAPILLVATPKGISRVDVGAYTGEMLPPARLAEVKNIAANLTTVSEQKDVTPPTKRKKISSLAKDLQKEAAKAQKEADELQKSVEYARKVYKQSRNAEEIAENNKLAMKLRKKGGWKDVIGTIADSTQNVGLEVLVRQAPTEFLVDLALRHPELQELARTKRLVETMDGRRAQMLEGGAALIDDLRALTKDKLEAFSEAILTSTIAQVDGRTDARETEITKLYRQLGPKGQEAYGKYFDYYDTMMGYLQQILVTNVEGLASTPAERDVFLKRINEMFAKENRIQPYAPLARDQGGEFFLGIGEGTNREFYIRRSAADRDALAKELAAQRGTTVEAMKASGELTMGNELSKLRSEMTAEGTLLRDIYEMIDQSGTKDEALKDAIFQMWVHLQPEQSMLKNFAKRKKYPPAGFTTDVIKNLNDSIIKFSNQLPRLQYMPQIRQSITQARAAIEDTPELTPYVAEIDRRVEDLLNPTAEGTWGQIVTLANSSTFSYYMSMSTGVLQILGTYQTGIPQLLKNHSFADVNKELGNLLPVFSSTGTHDKRGKWKMPTITEAAALEANKNDKPDVALRKAEDRKLVQLMRDRNVVEATAARDIFNFSEVPTELVDSKLQRAKVTYDTMVGGLIHHTERLSREAIYLASARLWKKKFAEEFRKTEEYTALKTPEAKRAAEHAHVMSRIDEIADKAAYDVQTSLFNYSKFGKPRYMNAPTGRLITQFMTYQLNALVFMGRNLLGMVYPLGSDTRAGCIKAFTAAMLNTWVTSGALGLFGGKLLLGMLAAFSDGWEDEKPADMKDLEPTLWFKNKWLPETLGEVDVFGESTSKALAKIIADGPINYMTGLDAASRTSLIELGTLPDVELRATETIKGTFAEYALALAGPSVSMIIARAEGMQDIANGDIYKGAEKIMPSLLRNPMQAFRYGMDGETTKDGKTVVAPSGFTVGNLVGKSIGFSPVTVADVKTATRKAMIVEQKIIGEKTSILNELERAFRKGDGVAYGKALDKMNAYNYKYSMTYPEYAITGEMVRERIERRGKERAESSRGYRLKQENVFMATEMLGPSRRAAEEAEKEGQK
jgi:hypothetical protein